MGSFRAESLASEPMFLILLIYCLIYKFNEKDQITDNLFMLLGIRSPGRGWISEALILRPKTLVDGRKLHSTLGQWGPSFGKAHSRDGEAGLENEKAPNGVEKGGSLGMSLPNPMVLIVFLGPSRKHYYELNFTPPQRH